MQKMRIVQSLRRRALSSALLLQLASVMVMMCIFTTPAYAGSVDCSKAATSDEKKLCKESIADRTDTKLLAPDAPPTQWMVDGRKNYGALSLNVEGLNSSRRAQLSVTCNDKLSSNGGNSLELTDVMVRLLIGGYWSSSMHHGFDIRVDDNPSQTLSNDRGLNAAGVAQIQHPKQYTVLEELTLGSRVAVRVNQSDGPDLYFQFDLIGSAKAIGDVLKNCFQYDATTTTQPRKLTADQLSASLFDDL